MKKIIFLATLLLLCSCNGKRENGAEDQVQSASDCKGVYYIRDSYGALKKFNQYWVENIQSCRTENMPLSEWEQSEENWKKRNVQCTPQPTFPTMTLKSANNFYDYRNGKLFLDFDSSTGQFRRLILGEDKQGKPVFQRDTACFYVREDKEIEPVNPQDYGKQLLLDLTTSISSSTFTPMEIFRYSDDGSGNWYLTRFDDIGDWNFKFCPELTTPWLNCNALRNGDYMFWPLLDSATQAALKQEAVLVRTQFNYQETTKAEFDSLWSQNEKNNIEEGIGGSWKYHTQHQPDIPWYIDQSWRDYLIGKRPAMPDAYSVRVPPLCYMGWQTVTLSNGNEGKVWGEICYINGEYTFTQD